EGVDTISTEACIEALEKLAEAVGQVSRDGGRILFATGHPAGLLPVHMAIAAAARSAGAVIDTCDHVIAVPEVGGDVRQIHDVWTWHLHGGSPHTHLAEPMRALLDDFAARGEPAPDLIIADHGWAGAAASRGLRTIGYADCHDPALFVAEAQGQIEATVPLADDVVPNLYAPLVEYVIDRAGLGGAASRCGRARGARPRFSRSRWPDLRPPRRRAGKPAPHRRAGSSTRGCRSR